MPLLIYIALLFILFYRQVFFRNCFVRSFHVALAEYISILVDKGQLLILDPLCHIEVRCSVPRCAGGELVIALPEVFEVVKLGFALDYPFAVFGQRTGRALSV